MGIEPGQSFAGAGSTHITDDRAVVLMLPHFPPKVLPAGEQMTDAASKVAV